MSYTMYPYDGVGNIPDAMFHWFWDQMVEQGLAETVFYSGHVRDSYQFALLIKTQTVPTIFIDDDTQRPVCMVWLSDAVDGRALGHFCILKEGRKYKLEMSAEILRYWIEVLGVNTILGVVPSFNKPAVKFMGEMGFVILGEIPTMVQHAGNYESAFIGYFSREEL